MNESPPPVLEEAAMPNRFARFAARFSVIAPLTAVLIYVLIGFLAVSGHVRFAPIEMIIVGLLPDVAFVVRFCFKHRRTSFGKITSQGNFRQSNCRALP